MEPSRRSGFAAAAACLVVLVLGGGVLGAAAVERRPPVPNGDVRATGLASDGVSDAETTTSSPATIVPTTTRPAVTPTSSPPKATATTRPPAASSRPAASTTTSSVPIRSTRTLFWPYNPADVEIPFSAGRTSWTADIAGVSVSIRIDKAAPRVGEAIEFQFELSSPTRICCDIGFLFGDGLGFDTQNGSCAGRRAGTHGPVRFTTSHTYNLEGRWTFVLQPITGSCVDASTDTAALFGTIEVGPGRSKAQGPSQPSVTFGKTLRPPGHEADLRWLSVVALARDEDGWLRPLEVDWGDGSPPQSFPEFGFSRELACPPTLSGWPLPTQSMLPTGSAIHEYAAHGTYTVTLTAVSTGCDGSERQSTQASFTWQATP